MCGAKKHNPNPATSRAHAQIAQYSHGQRIPDNQRFRNPGVEALTWHRMPKEVKSVQAGRNLISFYFLGYSTTLSVATLHRIERQDNR
jgi:hypothetical protein